MNKNVLIMGAISAMVVIASAAGGAILAVKAANEAKHENVKIEKGKEPASISVNTGLKGWQKENNGWYFYINGEKQKDWVLYNNRWYYLGSDGKMRSGWTQDNNEWYYLGSEGKMETGWLNYNGNWYYLNEDGVMQANTKVGEAYLNEKGIIEKRPN